MNLFDYISKRWGGTSGYRAVLMLAFPLIISFGSHTIQISVDRMFLNWYDTNAFAAAFPAGMVSFSLVCFFMGTGSYVNAFVAQYLGAKRLERIGASLWQAIYFCIMSGLVLLLAVPFARPFFELWGHDEAVMEYEIIYFRILMLGAGVTVLGSTLEGFFAGLHRPLIIMWMNIVGTLVNIVLSYMLVFGNFGFPEMGITGAAIATVISTMFKCSVYLLRLFASNFRDEFALLSAWRFDGELFWRMMRFGVPNGIQFFIDISSITIFFLLIGRIGTMELAASNLALQINLLAYLPMVGFGIATTTLVGRALGANNPVLANQATWSSFQLAFGYMVPIAVAYYLIPDLFIWPFAVHSVDENFDQVRHITIVLLRFVAFYTLFDTMSVIFAGALKGAGDTRFVMMVQLYLSWLVLVTPTAILVWYGSKSITLPWLFFTGYVCVLGFGFLFRYRGGKWMDMRVIEKSVSAK